MTDYQEVPPHAKPKAERRNDDQGGVLICAGLFGLVGMVTGAIIMWLIIA